MISRCGEPLTRLASIRSGRPDSLAALGSNSLPSHLSIQARWLNQIEIYFSILQRKVLQPNAIDSLFALEDRILAFGERYQQEATPFDWKYPRHDLAKLLAKLNLEHPSHQQAA